MSTTNSQNEVQEVEYDLPMSFKLPLKKFYKRSCYEKYYDYICTLMNETKNKWISITGTPGIGKSIFYIYFFQRYKRENPNVTIVTASFNKNRELEKCIVFEGDKHYISKELPFPFIENALHLYDGPPNMKPPDNKMVCFTSPNYGWFDIIRKEQYHNRLFMPIWTLEELQQANILLGLGINEEVLNERFSYFGGTARLCLALNSDYYKKALSSMEKRTLTFKSLVYLEKLLHDKCLEEEVKHSIFHYVPVLSEHPHFMPFFSKLTFCSDRVSQDIFFNIQNNLEQEEKQFVHFLRYFPEAPTFLGWLFENKCHKSFVEGGQFSFTSLSKNNENIILKL